MAETASEIQSRLSKVRAAIDKVLSAQSYSIGQHSVNKVQLNQLMQLEKDLMRRLARATGSGPLIIGNFSTADNT